MRISPYKLLLSAPAAAGSIFLTMHLTNQANVSLMSRELNLENTPEIDEKLLEPTKLPPPPPPPKPPEEEKGKKEEAGGEGKKTEEEDSQSQSSSSSREGNMDPEEVIKFAANTIRSKIGF